MEFARGLVLAGCVLCVGFVSSRGKISNSTSLSRWISINSVKRREWKPCNSNPIPRIGDAKHYFLQSPGVRDPATVYITMPRDSGQLSQKVERYSIVRSCKLDFNQKHLHPPNVVKFRKEAAWLDCRFQIGRGHWHTGRQGPSR